MIFFISLSTVTCGVSELLGGDDPASDSDLSVPRLRRQLLLSYTILLNPLRPFSAFRQISFLGG